MSELYFAEPYWVHLFWGVLAFVGLLIYLERQQSGAVAQFASVVLQPRLVSRNSVAQRVWRIIFLALFAVFSTLAMMRPQWGFDVVATPRVGAEIMICLDVSKSMLAEDAVPNRLGRAKADIRDLLSYLDGDQVGLIAFAGRASVLSPLTPDFDFLRLALDNANPNAVSRGGTRLEEPIRKAIEGFGAAGDISRSILLISDGEDHDSFPLEAAKAAAERGIRILAVGFGDEAGSELLITDPVTKAREIVRTSDGTPVRTRLDGELLRELALLTDGAYIPAGTGALDLQSIYDNHIGPLTRGQLDGQTRTVRNDAYQWAIVLAGLALLGAVLCTLRTNRAAALQVAVLCVVLFLSGPAPSARAQGQGSDNSIDPTTDAKSKTGPKLGPKPGLESTTQTQPDASSKQEQNKQPEPARTVYNQGLTALDANDVSLSVERFERARASAGTDGETRFRATYSLGWTEVRQADSLLDEEPKQALEALERAAVWFRDAVSLRPKAEPPRYNLELIERRISQLADALAKKSDEDLGALLEALIMSQRQVLRDIGAQLEKARSAPSPNTTTVARQSHRALSARQLANIELANTLSVRAQREGDALKAKSEQKTPQEALREAQLGGLGHFLHIAQEKLTGTRARLRRVQTEPAYRRGADGLDALKQARDQLLDPIQRLDALLTDERELVALSRVRINAAVTTVTPGAGDAASSAPAWATDQYLSEAQARLIQRLLELSTGLEHAQQQPVAAPTSQSNAGALLPGAPPAPAPVDPKQAQAQERLRTLAGEALPLLGEATRAFEQATERLQEGNIGDAHAAQHEGYLALASARELFLDLRRLIETTYQTQTTLAAAIVHLKANAKASSNANIKLGETLDLTSPAKRNLARMQRLGRMLSDELTTQSAAGTGNANSNSARNANPEQQRIEQGYEHWRLANEQMHASLTPLELANTDIAARESAAAAVELSLVHLQNLRRLFFSVIEHLKETAQRQQRLNDETESQRTLPDSKPEQAARLSAEQKTLGETTNSIAEALSQQAAQSQTGPAPNPNAPNPPAPNTPTPTPGPSAQEIEQLQQASGLVKDASQAMTKAHTALAVPDLGGARAPQMEAFTKLSEAIAALTPPQHTEDSPEDSTEHGEDEQTGAGDKQPPAPAEEDGQEQAETPSNMDQLLQQVRDKEAQRRRDRTARASRYVPVEKDW
ncbi:MAG: Ca-activated chloride channel family protein [Gammaproteobacteria bacterium]